MNTLKNQKLATMEYKPFEIIENQKRVIDDLTYKLKYSKNKVKDAKDINTLIKTLKCMDSMLVSKYYTDAIEVLIITLFYELLMTYKAYDKEIPLIQIFDTIKTDIFYGKDLKKKQVISILEHHEMQNKIKNNTVFDKDYINFEQLLNNFVSELKLNIKWNTTK